jgi:hypothetical protein
MLPMGLSRGWLGSLALVAYIDFDGRSRLSPTSLGDVAHPAV